LPSHPSGGTPLLLQCFKIIVAARRKPSGAFYTAGTGGLAPFRFFFLSFNPLAPYENHTIFSLPSFSNHPRFVNASKLGGVG
jgi:hypothetical protein